MSGYSYFTLKSLARAAYSRRRIILLDDVLSGLDTNTERHCFNSLLGESGILRQSQTTVVFVTHSGIFLVSSTIKLLKLS